MKKSIPYSDKGKVNAKADLMKEYYLDSYGFVQVIYGKTIEEIYRKIREQRE